MRGRADGQAAVARDHAATASYVWRLATLSVCVLAGACSVGCSLGRHHDPGCGWVSPCPQRFDVNSWCQDHGGHCLIQGGGAFAYDLGRGETASIPVEQFAADITDEHDLVVDYAGTSAPQPDPSKAIVLLDGVPGVPTGASPGPNLAFEWVFAWDPFPASPGLLEVRFEDGSSEGATVFLLFVNRSCELANPGPECVE
jgi:hypothetical protein